MNPRRTSSRRRYAPVVGRTVLITGGTGGIGRATALGLATMGAHVAITGRDRERSRDAAREIRAAGGGQVDEFLVDMSSQSEVRRMADEMLQRFPGSTSSSITSGGTGTLGTSPPMGSSGPSPSTISRHSCSPTFCWTG